jgi:hypothetical protein
MKNHEQEIVEFIPDMVEDLWWVFHLSQDIYPGVQHDLTKAFCQCEIQVVSEHLSEPFFRILFQDTMTDVLFQISSPDDLAPYLFLGIKADFVLPPETPASRLNADLFLEYGKLCYEILRPKHAFAENLNTHIEMADVDASRLTHICWANLFGPRFVKGIGREILINAPAWRNENLGDGGILYVLAASPYLYRGPRQYWEAARQYFRQHIPRPIVWSDMPQ